MISHLSTDACIMKDKTFSNGSCRILSQSLRSSSRVLGSILRQLNNKMGEGPLSFTSGDVECANPLSQSTGKVKVYSTQWHRALRSKWKGVGGDLIHPGSKSFTVSNTPRQHSASTDNQFYITYTYSTMGARRWQFVYYGHTSKVLGGFGI